jgi:hypothetical protein
MTQNYFGIQERENEIYVACFFMDKRETFNYFDK